MPIVWALRPVTAASVRIGVPIAPNATGAVFAISDRPAAYSGVKPSPIKSAEQIATGVPKPDAPSMNAPKENATSSAWIRRSVDTRPTDAFTMSNCPVDTVSEYRKTAFRTIQPMGRKP